MQVVLELSDQEYRNALCLCKVYGKPEKYENLVQIIKTILEREVVCNKIVTKVFADIMTEDNTDEFSFWEEDIKRAFPDE